MSSPRNWLAAALILTGLIGLSWVAGLTLRQEYTVYADGRLLEVAGRFEQVGDVLAAAGVTVQVKDLVYPPLDAAAREDVAIQVQRARPVTVSTASGDRQFWTQQEQLAPFLAENDIVIQRTDQVVADGKALAFGELLAAPLPRHLEIGAFLSVTIHDSGRVRPWRTAAQTVGAALAEAGISLYAADSVEPPAGAWLTPGLSIQVRRSIPLSVKVDGQVIQTRSHQRQAMAVLAERGIGLIGDDYARPGPEVALRPGDVIEVIRVTEDFRIVDEAIPFETRWQATDRLDLDQRGLLQAGEPGVRRQRIRIRYENGVPVGESLDGEWTAREPIPEFLGYGTRIVVRTVATPQGPREYWRVVRMRVTSYTAASSGKAPDHPRYGIVAVDPRIVPFMSEVFVPGYGVALAGDTGGAVLGRWIDLGYDEGNFVSWSGYVDVYYLTPVPAPENINYLLPTRLP